MNFYCYSGSASGEDLSCERDIPSPDALPETSLTSPTRIPKSPSKVGSSKKKGYPSSTTKATRVVHTANRTLYTAGRPPWYDSHGMLKDAFVIGQY